MDNRIESQYDPNRDVCQGIDGDPLMVSWAEYDLYHSVQQLVKRVEELERELTLYRELAKGSSDV